MGPLFSFAGHQTKLEKAIRELDIARIAGPSPTNQPSAVCRGRKWIKLLNKVWGGKNYPTFYLVEPKNG